MIESIITFFMCVMFACIFVQRDRSQLYAASIFAGMTILHAITMSDLDGFAYFFSAAANDLFIIIALSKLIEPSKMIINLQQLSIMSMVLNLTGWGMYEAYFEPLFYSMAYMLLYSLGIYVMLKDREHVDTNHYREGWRGLGVYHSRSERHHRLS